MQYLNLNTLKSSIWSREKWLKLKLVWFLSYHRYMKDTLNNITWNFTLNLKTCLCNHKEITTNTWEKYHTSWMDFHDPFCKYRNLNFLMKLPVLESPWKDMPVMYDTWLRVILNLCCLHWCTMRKDCLL